MGPAAILLLAGLVSSAQPFAVPAANSPYQAMQPADEAALKAAYLANTHAVLLDYLRKRSTLAGDQSRITELVRQLKDPTPARRDQAAGELVCHGQAAVLALRQVVNNGEDAEATERARQCLQSIEGAAGVNLTLAVIRALVAQNQPGTVEAILQYLPFAEDEQVVGHIQAALIALGLGNAASMELLRKSLDDPAPVRRAVAATVLARVGGSAHFAAIRPLLKDARPSVRLKVAIALIDSNDAEAVPVLIDLLAELPLRQRKEAEDYLAALAGDWTLVAPSGEDVPARRLKRGLWTAWWNAFTTEVLLQEFHLRTLSNEDRAKVLALIGKLSQDSTDERGKASEELAALGPRIAPLLRQVSHGDNGRLALGAAKVLQSLDADPPPPMPNGAGRLLLLRAGPAALPTLLAYLPFAETLESADEMRLLIARAGWQGGQPSALLVQALQDPVSDRRSAAALALLGAVKGDSTSDPTHHSPLATHKPQPEHLAMVRKLLSDPDGDVRLTIGLALARAGERGAFPVLISLLAELPLEQAALVEDFLANLAGSAAPRMVLSNDPAQRKSCRDAWQQWWTTQGPKIDLTQAMNLPAYMGHLVIVENYNVTRRSGSVAELDRTGKVRWQIDNLVYPMDAQVLPGGRVLIAEQSASRITERDQSGKIVWERPLASAFYVRRLANGHTILGGRNAIQELDAQGKEVFSHHRPNETILAIKRLRDGQTAYVTYQGNYVRLDEKGKEVKTFHVPFNQNFGVAGADVLAGDRVLVAVAQLGKVTEYDAAGKVAWEGSVANAGMPTRLANGNTLVVVNAGAQLVELDRAGKIVSEWKDLAFRPFRASKR